jgi:plasmid stabilization system protein ParE
MSIALTETEREVLTLTAEHPEDLEHIYQQLHKPTKPIALAEAADALRSLVDRGLLAPGDGPSDPAVPGPDDPSRFWKARFAMTPEGRAAWASSRATHGEPKPVSLFGIWKDIGLDLSREAIDELRREMWGNFPRDEPK